MWYDVVIEAQNVGRIPPKVLFQGRKFYRYPEKPALASSIGHSLPTPNTVCMLSCALKCLKAQSRRNFIKIFRPEAAAHPVLPASCCLDSDRLASHVDKIQNQEIRGGTVQFSVQILTLPVQDARAENALRESIGSLSRDEYIQRRRKYLPTPFVR